MPDVSGPYDPCAAGAVIDLNTAGTRDGETTRYRGNNLNVPSGTVLVPSCLDTPGHQVALRYVPRANTRLRISTDNAGTDATFDTVVFVQRMCAPSGGDAGARDSLGCNDDGAATGSTRRYASGLTTDAVTMGQPVFIVVAGYLSGAGQPVSGFMARGNFELTVTELTTVPVGGACDSMGLTNTCAAGSHCYTASGMSTCRAFVSAGGMCNGLDARCAAGNTCVTPSGATMGTCRADGSVAGTTCREAEPRCDMGLECSALRCIAVVATGGACDSSRRCATGNTCITPTGASEGVCRANGSVVGTTCRADAPRCDTGLECLSGTCIQTVAAGGACDSLRRCTAGTTCITPSGATAGVCRVNGTVAGTACRDAAPRCDTGLGCTTTTGSGTCRAVIAVGQPCVLGLADAPCAMGSLCAPTSPTMGVCTTPVSGVTPGTMPMGAPVATATRVYGGSFMAMGQHCYAVTVPMGQSLFVQSGLATNPGCSGGDDPLVRVYNPAGMQIASFDDTSGFGLCAVGNPASTTALRNLAAGNYAVCITGFSNRAVSNYLLTVGLVASAP